MSRKRNGSFDWPVWVLGIALLGAVACSGQAPREEAATSDASAGQEAADDGQAPGFTLADLNGEMVSLDDSVGQVRLIDFWATWCAPCREEIPMLNELNATYGGDGLVILGISDVDEGPDVIKPFVEEYKIQYTNLIGNADVSSSYKVYGLPTAFLVDGQGKIVKTFFGPKPRKPLEALIRELLELPPAT